MRTRPVISLENRGGKYRLRLTSHPGTSMLHEKVCSSRTIRSKVPIDHSRLTWASRHREATLQNRRRIVMSVCKPWEPVLNHKQNLPEAVACGKVDKDPRDPSGTADSSWDLRWRDLDRESDHPPYREKALERVHRPNEALRGSFYQQTAS